MMQDKKALQAGTSHNLGQNFAKAFDTMFQGRDGKQHHVWQTSWGVSTRLIGGLIMTHSDDAGLMVPPKLAPTHVVIIPIVGKAPDAEKAQVMEKAHALAADLRKAGLGVVVDDDETKSPGFKYNEHELQGTCMRMELGPKDLAKGSCVMVRRDAAQKEFVPLDQAVAKAQAMLDADAEGAVREGEGLPRRAHLRGQLLRGDEGDARTTASCWRTGTGTRRCEARIKEETGLTTRNRPFSLKQEPGKCVVTGKPSPGRIVFSKAY